jgi:ribose transport system substrate-binding protein
MNPGLTLPAALRRSASAARLVRGIVLLTACAAIAGCARENPSATSPGATEARSLKLAFVTNNAADYWTIARKGTEQAERELDRVSVEFMMPSDATAAEQKRIVDDLLAAGIDGIAISPIDPANQTQMIDAAAAMVPVIAQDSDAPQSKRLAYIGTDNLAAGRTAGELLKEALPDGGKVMVFVGKADAQNAQERFNGLTEAIQGSKIEILGILTDNTDRVRAKANVVETLVKHPEIAGLVGLWAYNGPAILNAVRESRATGRVKIIAFVEEDETLAGVKSGEIHGTVVQQPYEIGRQAIAVLAEYIRGNQSIIPESKQIIIPARAVRKDDVGEFTRQLNQWRGRAAPAQ